MEIIEKYELAAPVITGIFQVVCLFMLYRLNGRHERKKDIRSVKEEVYASAMHRLFLQKNLLINRSEDKLAQAEAEEAISLNASRILICGSADVYKQYEAINAILKHIVKKVLEDETKTSFNENKTRVLYYIFDKEISRLVLRMKQELDYGVDGWKKLAPSRCPVCNSIVKDYEGCSDCDMSYIDRILFDITPDYRDRKFKEYEERKKSRGICF